jgi:hypothetical protein
VDDLIFVDRAVTGKSTRRQGLKDFHRALAEDRADVAIYFEWMRNPLTICPGSVLGN